MSKKGGIGIIAALAVGIGLYFLIKNKSINLSNIQTGSNQTGSNQTGSNQTGSKANIDNADLVPNITPDIVKTLQSFGITEGSSITNIIHGGTPCGYRGTNGKCYADREEAERNGAA